LGLAIAKHVVQRHGGELRIQSQVGQGSTFMLVLPAARIEVLSD
jgi:two-component system phosphate regulon sensor histidine kinase PhoR